MLTTKILPLSASGWLETALSLLQAGQLVAFPTDTVYGLGGLAFQADAIDLLYRVKGRDTAKAIAVLVGEVGALTQVTASMGEMAERFARRFWPGPLTLVVARHPRLPHNISPTPTIGVRMPAHPTALALLRAAGPLAVTSANLSEAANTICAQEVYDQLSGRIPLILDGGRTPGGLPSTVVDCTGPQPLILRQGPISLEEIKAVAE
jgi:L-threonylcarbamoyladenylate synthase